MLAQSGSKEGFFDRGAVDAAAQMASHTGTATLIGRRLGVYHVLAPIGAGGMGEVYRARDTKLGRDVAIKILSQAFTADPDRLGRFEREARVLAALNHPHIGAIHGVEDSDGVHALVLELVEGETLVEKLSRGSRLKAHAGFPPSEALTFARQIADALEAAHEKGIIHRDLKPANIKITPDGVVKVLDFGLAKLEAGAGDGGIADSPTVTMGDTREGLIVGTAAYMSPEQARGLAVDKRTDIWAFGCVLYEMLAGAPAFARDTITDTLAAILEHEPDWKRLPGDTATTTVRLLRRCLEKDPKRRLHDIADARIEIEEALQDPGRIGQVESVARESRPSQRTARRALWASVGAVALIVSGVAVWNVARTPRSAPAVAQVVVPVPRGDREVGELRHPVFAISSDGTRLVYVQHPTGGTTQLYQRTLDQREFQPMPGTEGGERPFLSPDGQWVGFLAGGKVKKVSISGGPPVVLCELAGFQAATWGANDIIVIAQDSRTGGGLLRVSATGGAPQTVTRVDPAKGEAAHAWPQLLPGGKAVLFSIRSVSGGWDDAAIAVQSLETGERRVLIQGGTQPRYAPSGHLVYARAGTLMAIGFDLARLVVTGTPVPILEGVSYHRSQMADAMQFSLSDFSGSLLYLSSTQLSDVARLVWVDRTGNAQPLNAPLRPYQWPRLSPDGLRIGLTIQAATNDIWAYDVTQETLSRLTFDGQNDFEIWTPDGTRVTFTSYRDGDASLLSKIADGGGTEERLAIGEGEELPSAFSWSPDGRLLLFAKGGDIWILPVDGDRKPQPFIQTPFVEGYARVSPDGRWVAYLSEESGRNEVYVQAFPGLGEKKQISTDGATEPVWARNGRELFYRNADKMMAVEVTSSPRFTASKPRLLFEKPYARVSSRPNYDVASDGRFLMLQRIDEESAPTYLNVTLNWVEELKQRVPVAK